MSKVTLFNSNVFKALSITTVLALTGCGNDSDKMDSWSLDSKQSTLHFSSTKNGDVTEAHQFKSFDGKINENGDFTLTIDLTSVDTGIEIRDERMQKYLFMTENNPKATITGHIEPSAIPADSATQDINAELALAGKTTQVQANVTISRLDDKKLLVKTTKPVMLSTEQLGVKAGVDKLQEIAGLSSIGDQVPVTFELTLTR